MNTIKQDLFMEQVEINYAPGDAPMIGSLDDGPTPLHENVAPVHDSVGQF